MGSFDPLKVNQPIEIETPAGIRYHSKVDSLYPDRLVILSPMKGGKLIDLQPGTVVKINYTDNVAVYSFLTEVVSGQDAGHGFLTLSKPTETRRIQRRNFVRLDTKLPLEFFRVDQDLNPGTESHNATIVDISGGGLMFTCNTSVEMGELLEVNLSLSDKEAIGAVGRIVRFVSNPSAAKDRYSAGFEFTIIEEAERDRIIKYIFNKQRELRRKGLL